MLEGNPVLNAVVSSLSSFEAPSISPSSQRELTDCFGRGSDDQEAQVFIAWLDEALTKHGVVSLRTISVQGNHLTLELVNIDVTQRLLCTMGTWIFQLP